MSPNFFLKWTALASLALLPGCGLTRRAEVVMPTKAAPKVAPSDTEMEVGTIRFVRGTGQPFVLIRLAPGVTLPEKAILETRPSEGEPARLALDPEVRTRDRTANILSGRPRIGERVVLPFPSGDHLDPGALAPETAAPNSWVTADGDTTSIPPSLSLPASESISSAEIAPPLPEVETPATPIRLGERVKVRVTGGESTLESDNEDNPLPLPQRALLPGEESPFMEELPQE